MTVYSWVKGVSGDWNIATSWVPAAVPDSLGAVSIDAPATNGAYDVTIPPGVTETIFGITMNGTQNAAGTNIATYTAAELTIDGTLAFVPGSPGLLDGPLQNIVILDNGEIINPGTLNAFIQAQGTVLLTGTNGIYITNWLQALSGTVTVDTSSIAELTGNTLFDGIFEAQGTNSLVNLGGPLEHLIVNIATIEGPPANPTGWTEVYLDGPTDYVREWNGTAYVNLETTLTQIGPRGTVDVLGGRSYTTANTLTLTAGGMLNLQAADVTAAALDINSGGILQGSGTVANGVINNGTILATGGALDITGSITGTGTIAFDFDHKAGTIDPAGSVLEVNAVAAGQTITMNGDDILKLDNPSAFAGAISLQQGDEILLGGIQATSAVVSNGTLVLSDGTTVVDSIRLAGTYAGETFTTTTIAAGTTLTAGGTSNFDITDETLGTKASATGTLSGNQYVFTDLNPTNLFIESLAPSAFITTGAGNDDINVSRGTGNNIMDAGTGNNTMVLGSGQDIVNVNDVSPAASISDLVENFQAGDYVNILGVYPSAYTSQAKTVLGANGQNELQYTLSAPDHPTVTVTLLGYAFSDIGSRITATWGTTNGLPTGTALLSIHGT